MAAGGLLPLTPAPSRPKASGRQAFHAPFYRRRKARRRGHAPSRGSCDAGALGFFAREQAAIRNQPVLLGPAVLAESAAGPRLCRHGAAGAVRAGVRDRRPLPGAGRAARGLGRRGPARLPQGVPAGAPGPGGRGRQGGSHPPLPGARVPSPPARCGPAAGWPFRKCPPGLAFSQPFPPAAVSGRGDSNALPADPRESLLRAERPGAESGVRRAGDRGRGLGCAQPRPGLGDLLAVTL